MNWYGATAMPEIEPRYNIAPTTDIVVIRDGEAGRTGSMMRWGYPWWFNRLGKPHLMHSPLRDRS